MTSVATPEWRGQINPLTIRSSAADMTGKPTMKVASSQVAFSAAHRAGTLDAVAAVPARRVSLAAPPTRAVAFAVADRVELSYSSRSFDASCAGREDLREMDPKQIAAALAIEAIAGRRIEWRRFASSAAPEPASRTAAIAPSTPAAGGAGAATTRTTTAEIHAEFERTSIQAAGVVKTASGRTIRFAVSLEMEREFHSVRTTAAAPAPEPAPDPGTPPKAKDPLVVNLEGSGPARLTAAKVRFDLDANGAAEEISFVAEGGAFLVRDANGDGRANDGRELFGPQSGNGFADLAAYDADGNGWIDEADPVFTELRLWTSPSAELTTLASHGIGAIALASAETPFSLTANGGDGAASGSLLGAIRRTGVYLNEDGSAGTIQHVDIVAT